MQTALINANIVTLDANEQFIKDGCLVFTDDTITYLGETPKDLTIFDEVINIDGNVIMPGLVNTHGHTPMTLLRGLGDDMPLEVWLKERIWPFEGKFTEEHIYWGSQLAIIEMLKAGTTTFSDFYIYMDIIADLVEKTGIRANLSRGIIGFGAYSETEKKVLEGQSFAKKWMNKADGRITTMMSPHSAYTCSSDLIIDILSAAKEIGVPIQTHAAETITEVEQVKQKTGKTPIEYLNDLGVFDHQTLIAHAVHVSEQEIDILKTKNVMVSHNIGSNLKLGSGIAPIFQMLNKGITISLGTDGTASNNNLDLFNEIRLASLVHKGVLLDPTVIPASEILNMATINGAKSLFIDNLTGSLEIGKKADFIVIDVNQPHFYPKHNFLSHLVYSASGRDVKDVYVNGKQILRNRQTLTIDEEQVYFEVSRLTQNWNK